MKNIFIAISLFSSIAFTQEYLGQGSWQNNGGLGGNYDTYINVSETSYRSAYYDQYGKHERMIEMSGALESLELKVNGQHPGKGYCFSGSCVFDWNEGEDQMQETWTFISKSVVRSGRRLSSEGKNVFWRDNAALEE